MIKEILKLWPAISVCFFNQPKDGLLHSRLKEACGILRKHPHLHVQAIRAIHHVELPDRMSILVVEEELLKDWVAPKPSDYKAVMLQLLAAVEHLKVVDLPGFGLSGSNLARTRNGKAVLANLSSNWEQLWAGRSRAGESDYYRLLPPESAQSPGEFAEPQWVWSAGSLLVETLSGMAPTVSVQDEERDVFDSPISTYVNQQSDDFREAQLMMLPEDIQKVLRKALAQTPDDRYASLLIFRQALETPILTGKKGDRYVIPTAASVQEVSSSMKGTFIKYCLGILFFALVLAIAVWVVFINPAQQKGATLSGNGPGVILEPDQTWDKPVTAETPSTDIATPDMEIPVEEQVMTVDPVEPAQPTLDAEPVAIETVDVAGAALEESTAVPAVPVEDPSEVEKIPNAPEEAVPEVAVDIPQVDSTDLPEEAPIEVPPTPPEVESAQDRLFTQLQARGSSWADAGDDLSALSWNDLSQVQQAAVKGQIQTWLVSQEAAMALAENADTRAEVLHSIQSFWKATDQWDADLPNVTGLQDILNQRLNTMRVQIINHSTEPVILRDDNQEKLASLAENESTILEFPYDGDTRTLRAESATPWTFLDHDFASKKGRFVVWDIRKLQHHKTTVVLVEDPSIGELTVEYARQGEATLIPFTESIEVDPGDYRFHFSRPDYSAMRKVLRFSRAPAQYNIAPPEPSKWVPSADMARLIDWEGRVLTEALNIRMEMEGSDLPELKGISHQERLAALETKTDQVLNSSKVEVTVSAIETLTPPAQVHINTDEDETETLGRSESARVSPGKYTLRFSRPDYNDVERDWLLLADPDQADLLLPIESDWEPSDALKKLVELEQMMEVGNNKRTVQLIQELRSEKFDWKLNHDRYINLRKVWYRQSLPR